MFERFFSSRDKTVINRRRSLGQLSITSPQISVEQLQKELETAKGDWARFLLRLAETKVRAGEIQLVIDIQEDTSIEA